MPLLKNGIAPDRFEPWLRFGIGAGIGALLTGITLAIGWPASPRVSAAVVGCSALIFGLLARSLGDRLWREARWWLWLLWP
jgi:hypothetical protein